MPAFQTVAVEYILPVSVRFLFHSFRNMPVNVQRECRRSMTKIVLHCLNIVSILESINRECVTQIVNTRFLCTDFFHNALEIAVDRKDDVYALRRYSAKLLGLEEVIIKKVWEEETEKHIEIELPRRLHVCPDCGAETSKIHDYRMQSVKDIASSPAWRKKFFSKSGTFFQSPRLKLIKQKAKESIPWTISDLIPPPCSLSAC